MKIYNVIHQYDVDGGFGDAISQHKLLFITTSKEVAEQFVNKYTNPHVYDIPYSELWEGELVISEQTVIDTYNDIPQELIEWGEYNKTYQSVREENEEE
jgi:hypothetical protein